MPLRLTPEELSKPRICTTCNTPLPRTTEYFYADAKNVSDGLTSICKTCKRVTDNIYASKHRGESQKRAKEWYAANKETAAKNSQVYYQKYKQGIRIRQELKRLERKALINTIKTESGCVVCEYKVCPEAMDFHHVNPDEKDENIGTLAVSCSWERIEQEIEKCVVLCVRCHRELHARLITLPDQKEAV